jgi:hypothetical protein
MIVGTLACATLPTIRLWLRPFAPTTVRSIDEAGWWGPGLE